MKITSGEVVKSGNGLVEYEGVEKVMMIIDDSSSMTDEFGKVSRIDAVGQAIFVILDNSNRLMSHYGLSTINRQDTFVAPTGNYSALKVKVMRLAASGDTKYSVALRAARQLKVNRIILLADGEAFDKPASRIEARSCKDHGIRIDTVAVGDIDVDFLKELSEITGGLYTWCTNVDDLKTAFKKLETRARLQLEDKR